MYCIGLYRVIKNALWNALCKVSTLIIGVRLDLRVSLFFLFWKWSLSELHINFWLAEYKKSKLSQKSISNTNYIFLKYSSLKLYENGETRYGDLNVLQKCICRKLHVRIFYVFSFCYVFNFF